MSDGSVPVPGGAPPGPEDSESDGGILGGNWGLERVKGACASAGAHETQALVCGRRWGESSSRKVQGGGDSGSSGDGPARGGHVVVCARTIRHSITKARGELCTC